MSIQNLYPETKIQTTYSEPIFRIKKDIQNVYSEQMFQVSKRNLHSTLISRINNRNLNSQ